LKNPASENTVKTATRGNQDEKSNGGFFTAVEEELIYLMAC